MRWLQGALASLAAVFACSDASAQAPERRVALVVGNGAYRAVQRLANPQRDARLVADALRSVGFDVDTQFDLSKAAFDDALTAFSRKAASADVAVFYYAGHGIQLEQENWLVPVDARLEQTQDARAQAVRMEDLVEFLRGARRLRIIVLDACRDNPFALRLQADRRSVRRGLAPVEGLPGGTVIAFAAGPGQQASDNSAYAAALARRMQEPGIELSQMLRHLRRDVMIAAPPQEPWANESRSEDFYFVRQELLPPVNPPPPSAERAPPERPRVLIRFAGRRQREELRSIIPPDLAETGDVQPVASYDGRTELRFYQEVDRASANRLVQALRGRLRELDPEARDWSSRLGARPMELWIGPGARIEPP